MQKHERMLTPIQWNLVRDVCVVAMQRLASRRWLLWIEGSGIRDDLATGCETALLLDHQRLGLVLLGYLTACGGKQGGADYPDRLNPVYELLAFRLPRRR